MSKKYVAAKQDLSELSVTGIMTANGTVDLGFTPSAVLVVNNKVYPNSSSNICGIAFAFKDYPQVKNASFDLLTIIDNGFTTDGMCGYSTSDVLLRYIAFK